MLYSVLYLPNDFISFPGDMLAVDLRGKGKPCYKYKGFAGCVKGIACTQNENLILSVSLDRHFRVHDFHSKKLLRKDYMQSRLTSILVRSDFSLEPVKKTEEDNVENEDSEEKYDPEHHEMTNVGSRYHATDITSKEESADDGSDIEIVQEIDNDNENAEANSEEDDEEEGEEEASENEYYTDTDEDEEKENEGNESDEVEDEMFPLANVNKRKSSNADELSKKRSKSK